MDYEALQIFLPAFMVVFIGIVSIWAHIRKRKQLKTVSHGNNLQVSKIRLVDNSFKVLLIISLLVAVVYSYFPEYYYLTGPIDAFDNPVINTIGVLVLKVSLFWMVLAQFNIERAISRINSGVEQMSYYKLLSYSEKLILTGMLIMFFGLFITISSVAAVIICVAACFIFDQLLKFTH